VHCIYIVVAVIWTRFGIKSARWDVRHVGWVGEADHLMACKLQLFRFGGCTEGQPLLRFFRPGMFFWGSNSNACAGEQA